MKLNSATPLVQFLSLLAVEQGKPVCSYRIAKSGAWDTESILIFQEGGEWKVSILTGMDARAHSTGCERYEHTFVREEGGEKVALSVRSADGWKQIWVG